MTNEILLEYQDHISTVTLNRPAQRNAIRFHMWEELSHIFLRLDNDTNTKAIVIRGAGTESFCAGADIQDFEEYRNDSHQGYAYNAAVDNLLETLINLKTPTISMIQGVAAGGGCEIATATDIRIATPTTRMGIPVARLGITIGHREMTSLINLIGKGNALYILLSGRLVDGETALSMGLVTQVVPELDLEHITYQLAAEISQLAPLSHAINKEILNNVIESPSLTGLSQLQKELSLKQFDTKDYKEGYNAFLEKRKPDFIGE